MRVKKKMICYSICIEKHINMPKIHFTYYTIEDYNAAIALLKLHGSTPKQSAPRAPVQDIPIAQRRTMRAAAIEARTKIHEQAK